MPKIEEEPRRGGVTQKDIDNLLFDLAVYLPIYDSLDLQIRDEWDKVEAEAIGAEKDLTLRKEVVAANLKTFLQTLEERFTKNAN